MAIPTTFQFTRYLAAKKSVDDRALNRHVWHSLAQAMSPAVMDGPVQVLEIGAGIGTMVERLVERGLLRQTEYTAIDADPETVAASRHHLPAWMTQHGFNVQEETATRQRFGRDGHDIVVEAETIDVQRFVTRTSGCRVWDLVIAHAVLDLLDLATTLPGLVSLLRQVGCAISPSLLTGRRFCNRRLTRHSTYKSKSSTIRPWTCVGLPVIVQATVTPGGIYSAICALPVWKSWMPAVPTGSSSPVPRGIPAMKLIFCTSLSTPSALR